jgi:outer membrane lipoprotein SlyB
MRTPNTARAFARLGSGWLGAALVPVVFLSGCATNTQTGALAGAGLGGATGAAIGAAAHNPVAGAIIGATAGTLIGASAGAEADRREYTKAVRQDVAARGGPMTLEQVRDMAQNHVADSVIIDQIHLTRTYYTLTPEQIIWLRQEGVSDAVVQAMQMTAYGPPRRVVYVAEPPPPVVGVGFGFGHRW